jgi:hypothetical protein
LLEEYNVVLREVFPRLGVLRAGRRVSVQGHQRGGVPGEARRDRRTRAMPTEPNPDRSRMTLVLTG